MQDYFETNCNALPLSGANNAKYDIILMRKYFLPLLVNEGDIESIAIKKANPFVSFKFEDVKLLGILNFFGGAKRLNFFLKAYKTSETKGHFPYQWFEDPEKLNNTQLPLYDTIFSKLCNIIPAKETIQTFKV